MRWATLSIAVGLLIQSVYVSAKEVDGRQIPDRVQWNDSELVLNGSSLRKFSIMFIPLAKVYIGALYLKEKTTDAAKILSLNSPVVVTQLFLRDISKERMDGKWREAIEKCKSDCEKLKANMELFLQGTKPVKEGDIISLRFTKDAIEVEKGSDGSHVVSDPQFSRFMLELFVGAHASESLRNELLGK